ncbi:M4 family metallopeptidase [Streptomyces sp. NPDC087440]|uniref:M4 family metallopeptidase n=1 Tax=Streptomyces sp. NPDC087440 TaxID=3365790 RepID=UPI00380016F1
MSHSRRTAPAGASRRHRISGAAALLGVAALTLTAPGTAHAAPDPTPATGDVTPGQGTSTPALVRGIREAAPGTGSAPDAARTYLSRKRDRYRIADATRDLAPAGGTQTAGGQETVRLQQQHRGVPVLGGQYVVRMERAGGERVVTGTSGKYFTGLTASTTPQVDAALAVERAVDATRTRLTDRKFSDEDPVLEGTARGLVVLPQGPGVLTHHVTVRGTDPASGEPVLSEVYVDARAGYPVLQYSGIKTFTAPRATEGKPPLQATKGSGTKLDGKPVTLDVDHDETRGLYVLRDRTRLPQDDGYNRTLSTWDARGTWASDVSGRWPEGIQEFSSPTPAFGTDATEAGAVDAHWGAARVFDYFKDKHGRDSLDGRGMTINSLVGISSYGMPYVNAFWDGQKMVYGIGDEEYLPLSAGLDVVGHEMTHAVVETSANLVYAGQSGAMNEAIADYFGNAIETAAYDVPMSDPDSGLVGDRLCRTKGPRDCALRDLGDGRTTAGSFVGVGYANDNGGVHLNSTIFGGALWDARKELGADLADRIVYKALTQYLTPIDGFTEGRAAVLAAAKDLQVTAAQQKALARAFTAHGIVPGWEQALGIDSEKLFGRIHTADTNLGAGGGWWAASKSNEAGSEPYSVWAGRVDGKGEKRLMSPNDGRYHVNPATDGKTVVWQAVGPGGTEVLSRPIAGGVIKKLWEGRATGSSLDVDGDLVAFDFYNHGGRMGVKYLSLKDPSKIESIGGGTYHRAHGSSASNGKVAYQERRRVALTETAPRAAEYSLATRLLTVATGENTVVRENPSGTSLGPTALNGTHLFWLLDDGSAEGRTTLRRSDLAGANIVDLSPQTGPNALNMYDLTVSADTVTVGTYVPDTAIRNESTGKLHQFAASGAPDAPGTYKGRVSCNRGEQIAAAAVSGAQVVWLDATTGTPDVVTRKTPRGRCG